MSLHCGVEPGFVKKYDSLLTPNAMSGRVVTAGFDHSLVAADLKIYCRRLGRFPVVMLHNS